MNEDLSDEEQFLLGMLAPDGFPKYYMKKPPGDDPFDYCRPPKQVDMVKLRWSKNRKAVDKCWTQFKSMMVGSIYIFDWWLLRSLFISQTSAFRMVIWAIVVEEHSRRALKKDTRSRFPHTKLLLQCMLVSVLFVMNVLFVMSLTDGFMNFRLLQPLRPYQQKAQTFFSQILKDLLSCDRVFKFFECIIPDSQRIWF